jgi:hypothetical protein
MSQLDDILAIDNEINTTPTTSDAARADVDSWNTWFASISNDAKTQDPTAIDEANKRVAAFRTDNIFIGPPAPNTPEVPIGPPTPKPLPQPGPYAPQFDQLEAIDAYFKQSYTLSDAAIQEKNDWTVWYAGLSLYDKTVDPTILAKAQSLKSRFDLDNTSTGPVTPTPVKPPAPYVPPSPSKPIAPAKPQPPAKPGSFFSTFGGQLGIAIAGSAIVAIAIKKLSTSSKGRR